MRNVKENVKEKESLQFVELLQLLITHYALRIT